jgi:hypothetical protein
MGGLAAGIRSAVATAQAVKKSLVTQTDGVVMGVTHQAWIGPGPDDHGVPISRPALVQKGAVLRKRPDGQVPTTGTRIEFLDPLPANGAVGRREPIDPRDLITLEGETDPGHIDEIPGVMVDPETNLPYVSVVWLA